MDSIEASYGSVVFQIKVLEAQRVELEKLLTQKFNEKMKESQELEKP